MKNTYLMGLSLVAVVAIFLSVSGCSFFTNYKSDNAIEEIVEEIIEYKTGLDIDLTPASPE